MPRDNNGNYAPPANSWNPAGPNGALAAPADFDALRTDMANEIGGSLDRNGRGGMAANLPMNNNRIVSLGQPQGSGNALRWEQLVKGDDLAAAESLVVPIEGSSFTVTGTAEISSIGDVYAGRKVDLIFAGNASIKHSSALVLPGAADIVTQVGEVYTFLNETAGVWKLIGYPSRIAVQSGSIQTGGFKNKLINGNFTVNQRNVVGSVTLTAGAYGFDRWKAGTAGCTYTFSVSAGITTISISAGSLVQAIEGDSILSGDYVLSWSGTSQGRVGNEALSDSPIKTTLSGGSSFTISFGVGTLSLVQLEYGQAQTGFELRPQSIELDMCQRYFQLVRVYMRAFNTTSAGPGINFYTAMSYAPMRATPTATLVTEHVTSGATEKMFFPLSSNSGFARAKAVAAGAEFTSDITYSLSAEL